MEIGKYYKSRFPLPPLPPPLESQLLNAYQHRKGRLLSGSRWFGFQLAEAQDAFCPC